MEAVRRRTIPGDRGPATVQPRRQRAGAAVHPARPAVLPGRGAGPT